MTYLGIDPGLDGGLALITHEGFLLKVAMPTIKVTGKDGKIKREIDRKGILSLLQVFSAHATIFSPFHAVIEEQIPVRNQHIQASHTLAKNYGILLMGFTAIQINYTEVPSDVWQSHFGIVSAKKGKGTTKEQAFRIAQQIYPDTDFRKSDRSHKAHDGMVDAVLIANYCQFLVKREEKIKGVKRNDMAQF